MGDERVHRSDLIIVGAGPAGMAAALAADRAGVRTTLIDENKSIGGTIDRELPSAIESSALSIDALRGAEMRSEIESLSARMELFTETSVRGCFPGNQLAIQREDGWQMLAAKQLIFAAGAYEFVPPFPGWTLPGVMTPGAAQSAVMRGDKFTGKRAVVAGTGPFLLVVANQLQAAGIEVVAVVETARRRRFVRHGIGLLGQRGSIRQGKDYLGSLRAAGIPLYWGHIVTEAHGVDKSDGRLNAVTVSCCNAHGQPVGDSMRFDVDTLCVGYGFVPRTKLARQAGCKLRYAHELGGWVADVDSTFLTSMPSIRVAGDSGGIVGAAVSELEGTLAGLAAARDLGCLSDEAYSVMSVPISHHWEHLQPSRRALGQIYRVPDRIVDLATAETVVCRCEGLTREEVEANIEFGEVSVQGVDVQGDDIQACKIASQLGAGDCHGKRCWPTVARLIAQKTGKTVAECGPGNTNPPALPSELATP